MNHMSLRLLGRTVRMRFDDSELLFPGWFLNVWNSYPSKQHIPFHVENHIKSSSVCAMEDISCEKRPSRMVNVRTSHIGWADSSSAVSSNNIRFCMRCIID